MPEVKWYVEDKEILSDKRREIRYNTTTGEAYLKIIKTKPDDEVIYRCQATNKFGKAECRANIIVNKVVKEEKPKVEAPKITEPLEAMFVTKGTNVTLEAKFEGTPKLQIKWFKNSKEIVDTERVIVEEKKTIYKIKNVKKEDSGKYEVRVSNTAGEAKTAATLQVTDKKSPDEKKAKPPRFIQSPTPQFVAENEVVILEANVDSYPTCSFEWYQRSVPIKVSKLSGVS